MEDPILGQSNQAANFELQISIKTNFPPSVLIFNINFNQEFLRSILIDRVPPSVLPVIILFPFSEDRLWQGYLDTIKCAPLIPHHYHCLVIMADDEAQKNAYPPRRKIECSIEEPIVIWMGPIDRCPNAPA